MILLNYKKNNTFCEKDKINFNKNKKIEELEEKIKEYENTINFEYIECPYCKSNKLISYGTYKRNIVICEEERKINIKRVLCKECGRSHALIPSFIKPYFVYESSFIDYNILLLTVRNKKNKEIEILLKVTRQLLRKWKIRFEKHKNYICTTFKVKKINEIIHKLFSNEFNRKYILENSMRYFS